MLNILHIIMIFGIYAIPCLGLECYKCVSILATLDEEENADTASIVSNLNTLSTIFLQTSFEAACLSSDVVALSGLESEECRSDEVCGYMNMTLTNDDYEGKGVLVLEGVIRQCQVGIKWRFSSKMEPIFTICDNGMENPFYICVAVDLHVISYKSFDMVWIHLSISPFPTEF